MELVRVGDAPAVPSPADVALAVVVGAACAVVSLQVTPWVVVLLLAASAALAWRRAAAGVAVAGVPPAVLAAWAGTPGIRDYEAGAAAGHVLLLGGAMLLITVYSAVAWGARATVVVAAAAGLVLAVAAGVLLEGITAGAPLGLAVGAVLVAWTAGQWRRAQRRVLAAALDGRRRAERERDQATALATAHERARVAREVHDVVAHSLAVVTAQADGARCVLDTAPDQARLALQAISDTGRAATRDMAGLLGVLAEPVDDEGTDHRPQPHLGDLPALLESVRAAGLSVTMASTGTQASTSPGTELALYRVVQESLTNVLKHAGAGAVAQVELVWAPDDVTVRVENTGSDVPATTTSGSGHGLTGLAVRARQHHGALRAEPLAGGGFRVEATLHLSAL